MKFLLLSLMGAIAFVFAPSAEAYTPDELAAKGKYSIRILEGHTFDDGSTVFSPFYTGCQNTPTFSQGNITLPVFNYNGAKYLKLGDFVDTSIFPDARDGYVFATINGNSFSVDLNLITMVLQWDGESWNGYPECRTLKRNLITQTGTNVGSKHYVSFPVKGTGYYGEKLFGSINTLSDGNFEIQMCDFVLYELIFRSGYRYVDGSNWVSSGGYYQLIEDNAYSTYGVIYRSYNENATVTDVEYEINDNNLNSLTKTENRNYTVFVDFKPDGTFTIDNFSNLGIATQIVRNGQYAVNSTESQFTGTYDLDFGNVTLNNTSLSAIIGNNNIYINYLTKDYNNGFSNLTGTIETTGYPTHIEGSNGWNYVTRYDNATIKFDPYITMYECPYYSGLRYLYDTSIQNTIINVTQGPFCTHDVEINKTEYGYGKINDKDESKYIYLNFNLTGFKNTDHVKDYELYIVPEVANPNYASSDFNHVDGHVNGTRIDLLKYAHNFFPSESDRRVRALAADEGEDENPFEGYRYNLLIPEDDLKAKNVNGNYQLYVKTNYTAESGLESTFHALTSLGATTTGVEGILEDRESNDKDAPVLYFNLNGVQMNGDNLTPGIYIKKQGTTTTKVVVK